MIHFRKSFFHIFGVLIFVCSGVQIEPNANKTIEPSQLGNYSENYFDISVIKEPLPQYSIQMLMTSLSKLTHNKCGEEAMTLLKAINNEEKWALQMFDSSSKFPVDPIYYQLGNFDECIEVEHPSQAQFCLVTIHTQPSAQSTRYTSNDTIHWSICVPNSCTANIIENVLQQSQVTCQIIENLPITSQEIVYAIIVCFFCGFIIVATALHFYLINKNEASKEQGTTKDIVLSFSLINTIGKLLKTESTSLNLECICGIRFLSMFAIVAGHTFLFTVGGPIQNQDFLQEESQKFENALFLNSPLLVDTFLLLSGFLMCYLLLIELEKRGGKINFLIIYLGRYIRLTPSYAVVLFFYCTYLFRIGSGPLWDHVKLEQDRCQKSWWTNMLYINNYVDTDNICMFQSWYLAVDFHLFIIAPLIIYPLYKRPKYGCYLLALFTTGAVIIPFIITYIDKLDPTLMAFAPELTDITQNYYFKNAYIKTHMRAGSYFIGMFFGYFLHHIQQKGIKIQRYVIYLGWFFSVILGIVSMESATVFYFTDHVFHPLENAFYCALHRVMWCFSIGWVLIVCVTKNSGLVNRFLSWKPFIPLSRLTYCAYLVNGFVEVYSLGTSRQASYLSKFALANKSLAHFVVTFAFAFVLCVLFESPIHSLETLILKKAGGTGKRSKAEVVENGESTNI